MKKSNSLLIAAVLWMSILLMNTMTACSVVERTVKPMPVSEWIAEFNR